MIYPFSSILMKKLGFKKVNRPQFRFVFAQILPLSIVLTACLSNPSVGQTTTSAVVEAEQDLKRDQLLLVHQVNYFHQRRPDRYETNGNIGMAFRT